MLAPSYLSSHTARAVARVFLLGAVGRAALLKRYLKHAATCDSACESPPRSNEIATITTREQHRTVLAEVRKRSNSS